MAANVSAKQSEYQRFWLIVATLALGIGGYFFLGQYVVLAGMGLLRLIGGPFKIVAGLDWLYLFPIGLLFSNPVAFWGTSALGLGLALVALPGCSQKSTRIALLLIVVAIVALPLVWHYRPVVESRPGVTMRVLTLPGFWESSSKAIGIGAEVCRCAYTLDGWDDNRALYYTETCGQRVHRWRYVPETDIHTRVDQAISVQLSQHRVSRPTDRVTSRMPNDESMLLTIRETVLRSPDNTWDAFVSRYVYGPEDVVVVAAEIP